MEIETDAEYFDYLAGLPNPHLHRVFAGLGYNLHQPNSWEKSKKGASALFLVVLRGFQRGKSKSPFGVFFLPPAAFSLPRKEKGAESPPRVLRTRKSPPHPPDAVPPRLWRGLRPRGRKKGVTPFGVTKTASFGRGLQEKNFSLRLSRVFLFV